MTRVTRRFLCSSAVLDAAGRVIAEITPANYQAVRGAFGGSSGCDVTGGMAGKIRELVDAAERFNVASYIFNADGGDFERFLSGEAVGTCVHAV